MSCLAVVLTALVQVWRACLAGLHMCRLGRCCVLHGAGAGPCQLCAAAYAAWTGRVGCVPGYLVSGKASSVPLCAFGHRWRMIQQATGQLLELNNLDHSDCIAQVTRQALQATRHRLLQLY
jgi:hypothetical protein